VFDAAVEAGVAAFMASETAPSDAEILARLESQGVAGWLAQRLVFFLPLAFGRRVLPGVQLSGEYDSQGTLRGLDSDPLYAAALERASQANRAEVERIGLRSAEVNAVNNALHAGSQLEDLVVGPPVAVQPLPPPGDGDGGVPSPKRLLVEALTQHGLTVEEGARVGALRFDARAFPHRASAGVIVQVDFLLRHPALAADPLIESLAGWGETWSTAIGQCVSKFAVCSLHPIMAGLLGARGGREVTRIPVDHPSGRFELCVGPTITMFASTGPEMGPVLTSLLDALPSVPLARAVHGLRIYLQHTDGALNINEVLLDGEPWEQGQVVVAATSFPDLPPMVATRLFGLLVPA
jgi:Family of unknown function (DUF6348)